MTKKIVSVILVTLLLFVTIVYAATTGSIQMSFMEFLTGLFEAENERMAAIKDLRFPRIIVAIFAGAALSVSGVLLQAIMRNPLADAGFIGISAGAAFTKLFIVSFIPTMFFFSPMAAFVGGAFACFLVYFTILEIRLKPVKTYFSRDCDQCDVFRFNGGND